MNKVENLTVGGVPLLLESSVSLASGGSALPDVRELQNPYRTPFVIDEIVFLLRWIRSGGTDFTNFGASIRARFAMGRVSVTSDHVPVWSFGPQIQGNSNVPPPTNNLVEGQSGLSGGVDSAGQLNTYSSFKWKLPVPLLVPPGNTLVPSFLRSADGMSGNVSVYVSYAGRRLESTFRMPADIDVPYVALYATERGADTGISSELHLVNPFLVPMRVQRLTGRVEQILANPVPFGNVQEDFALGLLDFPTDFGITMEDTYGYKVVKSTTPVGHVFDLPRRAWTFNKVLLPKERYTVRLNGTAGSMSNRLLTIAMIGHRKERIA